MSYAVSTVRESRTPDYGRRLQSRVCTFRPQYSSSYVAQNAATAFGWIGLQFVGLRPYECSACGYWHLYATLKNGARQ